MTDVMSAPRSMVIEPQLEQLRLDGGTQLRAEISVFRVQEYADAMKAGSIFPPVTVFYDGTDYWLADGFHRVEAAKACGLALAVDVREGSQRDAVLFSAGANAAHGQPRSNADKRNAVLALLNDPEWSQWSDREIARQCAVSQPFVGRLRSEIHTDNRYQYDRTFIHPKTGAPTRMRTESIGLDLPTTDEQATLDRYPDSVAQYAWDVYKAERRADTKRSRSATWLDRICKVTLEARDTGYTDVGGEQTPLSGALAWDDAESAKRQQEYRRDYSAKRDAQGNLTPEAREEWVLSEAERIKAGKPSSTHLNILSAASVEWYTPPEYIEAARDVMGGIDLDPASNETAQQVIQAATYYTKDDDGLTRHWQGRVWLNPPYGRACAEFVAKALQHYEQGEIQQAVLLLNSNSNETEWFQPLWDHTLCFSRGRINYYTPDGEVTSGSTHGSVFVYLGADWQSFARRFSEYGNVVRRVP